MLNEFGIPEVMQTGRLTEARRLLQERPFDVVLCDFHFEGETLTGPQLLEELRRSQRLPLSTVFMLVTSEASFPKVQEAAESPLDAYLVKPHSARTLAEKLLVVRRRKRVLRDIYAALDTQEYELAAQLCLDRYYRADEYALFCARIGAELLLKLGRPAQARDLYQAVQSGRNMPWARLGVARAQIDSGQIRPALRTLESLLADQPTYADAFDVKARAQIEQGELEAALETCRQAAELTPQSQTRLQKLGILAHYLGRSELALRALELSAAIGTSSRLFDFQGLVLMGQLHADQGNPGGLQRCEAALARAVREHPDSPRLARMLLCVQGLNLWLAGEHAAATQALQSLAAQVRLPDFDFEAACNLLSLNDRLCREGSIDLSRPDWLRDVGERFCVSKAACELLVRSAGADDAHQSDIRAAHAAVGQMARHAMQFAVSGQATEAVKQLLRDGKRTLNAKLLELAVLVLQRHSGSVQDGEQLIELATELRQQYCRHGTQVKLGDTTGRSPGALRLPG